MNRTEDHGPCIEKQVVAPGIPPFRQRCSGERRDRPTFGHFFWAHVRVFEDQHGSDGMFDADEGVADLGWNLATVLMDSYGGVDALWLVPVENVHGDGASGEGENAELEERDGEAADGACYDLDDGPNNLPDGNGFKQRIALGPVCYIFLGQARKI